MDLPSALPFDLEKRTRALLPLTQFQELCSEATKAEKIQPLTYKERYFILYSTDFPQVEVLFDNEEDRYLFCAGHFHSEVGWRSHLFLSPILCIRYAIRIRNWDLVKYFADQSVGLIENDQEICRMALQANSLEACKALQRPFDEQNQRLFYGFTITSPEVAHFLASSKGNSLFFVRLGIDRPLEEIQVWIGQARAESDKKKQANYDSLLLGLAMSNDNEKVKYLHELIEEKISDLGFYLLAIMYLDDLPAFQSLLTGDTLKPKWINWIFYTAARFAAINITRFLIKNREQFPLSAEEKWVGRNGYDFITHSDKVRVKTFLETFSSKLVNFRRSALWYQLLAELGDPQLLETKTISVGLLRRLQEKKEDVLFKELAAKAKVIMHGTAFMLPDLLASGVVFSADMKDCGDLTYPQAKALTNFMALHPGKIETKLQFLPTPHLMMSVTTCCKEDRVLFLTFPMIDPEKLTYAVKTNNLAYCQAFFNRCGKRDISLIKGNNINASSEMLELLAENDVIVDNRKSHHHNNNQDDSDTESYSSDENISANITHAIGKFFNQVESDSD